MTNKAAGTTPKIDLRGLADRLELEALRIRAVTPFPVAQSETEQARHHVRAAIDDQIARWETCCRNNPPPTPGWEFDQAVLTEWIRVRFMLDSTRPVADAPGAENAP